MSVVFAAKRKAAWGNEDPRACYLVRCSPAVTAALLLLETPPLLILTPLTLLLLAPTTLLMGKGKVPYHKVFWSAHSRGYGGCAFAAG